MKRLIDDEDFFMEVKQLYCQRGTCQSLPYYDVVNVLEFRHRLLNGKLRKVIFIQERKFE